MKLSRASRLQPLPKLVVLLVGLVLLASTLPWDHTNAAQLTDRSLQLSASTVSAPNTIYNFLFSLVTPGTLGSIVLELCTNDPFPETPCTPPPGLDMTGAALATQTGEVGFAIDASSSANKILLSRAPSAASAGPVNYVFNNVTNPNAAATYYGRLMTYATNDGSGPVTDKAGIAWTTNNDFSLNTEVPQFLEFCSGITISAFDCNTAVGDYINFGILTTASSASATSQMVAASNAGFGYNITIYGLSMTSGINVIPALATQTFAAPGNSQFGINARANSLPAIGADPIGPGIANVDPNYNVPDQYRFNDGEVLVSSSGSSDYRKFTVTYLTNVSATQPPGRYGSTITYVSLANF